MWSGIDLGKFWSGIDWSTVWAGLEAIAVAIATLVSVLAFLKARHSDAEAKRLATAQEQIAAEIAKLRRTPEAAWELIPTPGGTTLLRNVGNATAYNVRHPGTRIVSRAYDSGAQARPEAANPYSSQVSEGYTVAGSVGATVLPREEIHLGIVSVHHGSEFPVTWDNEAGQPRKWTGILW